jgi:hypothetical protein
VPLKTRLKKALKTKQKSFLYHIHRHIAHITHKLMVSALQIPIDSALAFFS